jgi:ubiquitin-conjugating enzyme E2 variant
MLDKNSPHGYEWNSLRDTHAMETRNGTRTRIESPIPMSKHSPERKHDGSGPGTFWFETLCVLVAAGLIVTHAVALWQLRSVWNSWLLLAVVLAWPAADFVSGLVHWLADTWGSEQFPIFGPRFIRPFRVHHVTPTSFLECNFVDTNGDTCLVAIPILISMFWIPIDSAIGLFTMTFGVCFCVFAIPTNQIHQWAHMPDPPWWVRRLQTCGFLLSNEEHARHHTLPYAGYYCITNGFCNRWLESIRFFRGLEWMISSITGIPPRREEERHMHEYQQHESNQ